MSDRRFDIEIRRVGWRWWTYRVVGHTHTWIGHGRRKFVTAAVARAIRETGEGE